jgi:hypothetical protein
MSDTRRAAMRLADLLESMASSYGQTFKTHAALVRELAKLVKHDGTLAEQQEPVAWEWPKQRDLFLRDDMGQGQLRVLLDSDNDVIVAIWPNGSPSVSLEFCNGGGGGGRSPETRKALLALMCAMGRDGASIRPVDGESVGAPVAQPREQEPVAWKVSPAYLAACCTDDNCALCRLPQYIRKSGMRHAGLTAYDRTSAAPVAQPLTDHCPMCAERLTAQREDQQWQADVAKGRALLAAAGAKP